MIHSFLAQTSLFIGFNDPNAPTPQNMRRARLALQGKGYEGIYEFAKTRDAVLLVLAEQASQITNNAITDLSAARYLFIDGEPHSRVIPSLGWFTAYKPQSHNCLLDLTHQCGFFGAVLRQADDSVFDNWGGILLPWQEEFQEEYEEAQAEHKLIAPTAKIIELALPSADPSLPPLARTLLRARRLDAKATRAP